MRSWNIISGRVLQTGWRTWSIWMLNQSDEVAGREEQFSQQFSQLLHSKYTINQWKDLWFLSSLIRSTRYMYMYSYCFLPSNNLQHPWLQLLESWTVSKWNLFLGRPLTSNDVYKEKLYRCFCGENWGKWKGWEPLGIELRTPCLCSQYSATELRQPDNHQLSQSSICTAEVVLSASVSHLAATQYVPSELR